MQRILVWLCLAAFVTQTTSCGGIGGHGPVSAGTMRKLQSRAISRDQFVSRLKGADHGIRRSLPSEVQTIPFELKSGTPTIRAMGPDGKPLSMLLDTGAARLVLSAATANQFRVPTINAKEVQATMLGVVGKESGLVGIIAPLHIGGWAIPSYPCFVRTYETSGDGITYPSDILGFDLIARYCSYLTLDYPKQKAFFAFKNSYQPTSAHSSFAQLRIKQDVASIELQSKGVKWSCILDTGSFNGIEIDEAIAKKLGVQDQGKIVEGLVLVAVGGLVSSDKARLRTVTLPEVKLLGGHYKQAEVDISPGIPRVGSYFLRDYRVTFDFRKKRVWLEW